MTHEPDRNRGDVNGPSPARQPSTTHRRVLWAANVRTKGFEERLAAVQAGNFTHMSVFPIDYRGWIAQGLTPSGMRRRLREVNVGILAIDPFVQWVPDFSIPDGYPEQNKGFIDFTEAEILTIAAELEAEAINCVEGLGQRYENSVLIDAFGGFADRAKARGLRVTLEFMPISSIASLADGWAIVCAANRDNAGLCFDSWHYFRSDPDAALLATIPAASIFEVQLADGRNPMEGDNLLEDLLRFRRLPGDGDFDTGSVIALLKRRGAWQSVGPEVFADAMDKLGVQNVGERCSASLDRWNAV
jgi:sugar phosphate isomerase/epimerase